jgi:hypothetical protein
MAMVFTAFTFHSQSGMAARLKRQVHFSSNRQRFHRFARVLGGRLWILPRLAFLVTNGRRALASRDDRSYFFACVDLRAICLGELPVKTAETKAPDARISRTVWLAGLAVRTIFIAILIVITARVASPQLEHIWSLWESPSDLVRVALGLAVCAWLLVHIFVLPKDTGGYRIWLYLGVAILPLSVLCAVVIW